MVSDKICPNGTCGTFRWPRKRRLAASCNDGLIMIDPLNTSDSAIFTCTRTCLSDSLDKFTFTGTALMFKNCMLIFVDLGYVQVKADEGRWLI